MHVQGMDVEMVIVVRDIEALSVVTVLSLLVAFSTNKLGYRVGLRCFSCQAVSNNKRDLYVSQTPAPQCSPVCRSFVLSVDDNT